MANLGQMLMQGPNSGSYTPETLDRRRQMAQALLKGSSGIQDIRHPLQGLAQMLQAGIGGYQSRRADEEEVEQRSAANERIAALLSSGTEAPMGDLVSAAGDPWAGDAQQQLAMMLLGEQVKKQNAPPPEADWQTLESGGDTFRWNAADPSSTPELFFDGPDAAADTTRPMTPEEKAAYGLPPEAAAQIDASGKVSTIGGGQTINVGGNNDIGSIPPGMMVTRDEAGNVTGMLPIPGGPAEAEALAAQNREAMGDGTKDTATGIITNAAALARDISSQGGTTGLVGGLMGNLSESQAAELRRQVGVLTSNATIQNLTAMRQASPTGGALGNVTEKEGAMLAAASGAIDPNSSAADFQRQLDDYERVLLEVVHGPEEGRRIFEQTRKGASGEIDPKYTSDTPPPDWGGDPALWRHMPPEDRALW